jgi:hypothetical protein
MIGLFYTFLRRFNIGWHLIVRAILLEGVK